MQMIEHEQQGHRGAFFVEDEGRRLAQLTYTMAGKKVILDHTEVDDALRGTGTGRKLVATKAGSQSVVQSSKIASSSLAVTSTRRRIRVS